MPYITWSAFQYKLCISLGPLLENVFECCTSKTGLSFNLYGKMVVKKECSRHNEILNVFVNISDIENWKT